MKVLVLLGGESTEREVSLRSGKSVMDALSGLDYEVICYDPVDGAEGLSSAVARADVVLPILHGDNGEDGAMQSILEDAGKPFLGSSSDVSRVTIDKQLTHEKLEAAGVKMPKFAVVNAGELDSNELSRKPFVLKTIDGGSSVDIIIARTVDDAVLAKASEVLGRRGKMIIEELVDGLEITVPVLGSQALPVIAIIPPENGEFDYSNKYNGSTKEICPVPSSLTTTLVQQEAQKLALKVHQTLGARHLSRTDMIVRPDGEIVVLELNTMPGMTAQSLFPKAALIAGYSMEKLADTFVKMVDLD